MKQRLDKIMLSQGLVESRSEAENWIRLGRVMVNGREVKKPGTFVNDSDTVTLRAPERYVSRAGLKLSSVASKLNADFAHAIVLDVGSSTGGFTDYALQHGAKKVFAVDVGTNQLHQKLRADERIELHEKTDIRDFVPSEKPDIVVIDVSFISLRQILPHIAAIIDDSTVVLAMVKPQFEASRQQLGGNGVIKNDKMRREILHDFERWAKERFVIQDKSDSEVAGAHGNRERFYKLVQIKQW